MQLNYPIQVHAIILFICGRNINNNRICLPETMTLGKGSTERLAPGGGGGGSRHGARRFLGYSYCFSYVTHLGCLFIVYCFPMGNTYLSIILTY